MKAIILEIDNIQDKNGYDVIIKKINEQNKSGKDAAEIEAFIAAEKAYKDKCNANRIATIGIKAGIDARYKARSNLNDKIEQAGKAAKDSAVEAGLADEEVIAADIAARVEAYTEEDEKGVIDAGILAEEKAIKIENDKLYNNDQSGGGKIVKKYVADLYTCNDKIKRRAYRVTGQGNKLFVMYKGKHTRVGNIPVKKVKNKK